MNQRVVLLGIPIDAVTQPEAVAIIREFLQSNDRHHVMTPNSEMLVEAQGNEEFAKVLRHTSLNIPDSAGLLWAAKWTGQQLPERVAGVDTVIQLAKALDGQPVFLLGGAGGVAEMAAAALQQLNASLRIVGTHSGSPRAEEAAEIVAKINAAQPALLLVAYGAPQQDLWIHRHLAEMLSVRVAMGVGGTFDFLAGRVRRAPLFMQRLHLEWLWRLGQEPRRWRRIWRALVVFPFRVVMGGRQRG